MAAAYVSFPTCVDVDGIPRGICESYGCQCPQFDHEEDGIMCKHCRCAPLKHKQIGSACVKKDPISLITCFCTSYKPSENGQCRSCNHGQEFHAGGELFDGLWAARINRQRDTIRTALQGTSQVSDAGISMQADMSGLTTRGSDLPQGNVGVLPTQGANYFPQGYFGGNYVPLPTQANNVLSHGSLTGLATQGLTVTQHSQMMMVHRQSSLKSAQQKRAMQSQRQQQTATPILKTVEVVVCSKRGGKLHRVAQAVKGYIRSSMNTAADLCQVFQASVGVSSYYGGIIDENNWNLDGNDEELYTTQTGFPLTKTDRIEWPAVDKPWKIFYYNALFDKVDAYRQEEQARQRAQKRRSRQWEEEEESDDESDDAIMQQPNRSQANTGTGVATSNVSAHARSNNESDGHDDRADNGNLQSLNSQRDGRPVVSDSSSSTQTPNPTNANVDESIPNIPSPNSITNPPATIPTMIITRPASPSLSDVDLFDVEPSRVEYTGLNEDQKEAVQRARSMNWPAQAIDVMVRTCTGREALEITTEYANGDQESYERGYALNQLLGMFQIRMCKRRGASDANRVDMVVPRFADASVEQESGITPQERAIALFHHLADEFKKEDQDGKVPNFGSAFHPTFENEAAFGSGVRSEFFRIYESLIMDGLVLEGDEGHRLPTCNGMLMQHGLYNFVGHFGGTAVLNGEAFASSGIAPVFRAIMLGGKVQDQTPTIKDIPDHRLQGVLQKIVQEGTQTESVISLDSTNDACGNEKPKAAMDERSANEDATDDATAAEKRQKDINEPTAEDQAREREYDAILLHETIKDTGVWGSYVNLSFDTLRTKAPGASKRLFRKNPTNGRFEIVEENRIEAVDAIVKHVVITSRIGAMKEIADAFEDTARVQEFVYLCTRGTGDFCRPLLNYIFPTFINVPKKSTVLGMFTYETEAAESESAPFYREALKLLAAGVMERQSDDPASPNYIGRFMLRATARYVVPKSATIRWRQVPEITAEPMGGYMFKSCFRIIEVRGSLLFNVQQLIDDISETTAKMYAGFSHA